MTSLRRFAALALLLLVPTVGGCGFGVQTDQDYQPADGVHDRSTVVNVLNALIITGENGSGGLVATLVNTDLDTPHALVEVSGTDVTGVTTTIPIGPEQLVNLAETGAIPVQGAKITPGAFVGLRFVFDNGDSVAMSVPVFENVGMYANIPLLGDEPDGAEVDAEGVIHEPEPGLDDAADH